MQARHIRGGEKTEWLKGRMSYSEEQSGSQTMSMSAQWVKHGSKNAKSRKRDGTSADRRGLRGTDRAKKKKKKEWEVCGL